MVATAVRLRSETGVRFLLSYHHEYGIAAEKTTRFMPLPIKLCELGLLNSLFLAGTNLSHPLGSSMMYSPMGVTKPIFYFPFIRFVVVVDASIIADIVAVGDSCDPSVVERSVSVCRSSICSSYLGMR